MKNKNVQKANNQDWSEKNACQIIEAVLNLEKSVQDSILEVHKCAGKSEYSYGNIKNKTEVAEDPHVNEN